MQKEIEVWHWRMQFLSQQTSTWGAASPSSLSSGRSVPQRITSTRDQRYITPIRSCWSFWTRREWSHLIYALQDDGSNVTILDDDVRRRIGVTGQKSSFCISTMSGEKHHPESQVMLKQFQIWICKQSVLMSRSWKKYSHTLKIFHWCHSKMWNQNCWLGVHTSTLSSISKWSREDQVSR